MAMVAHSDRASETEGRLRPFASSLDHLLAELQRIDFLIQSAVTRARKLATGSADFQGLCITEQELELALASPCGLPRWAENPQLLDASLVRTRDELTLRKNASVLAGITLKLDELAELFQLTPFDLDIVLVCLAPEMDLRYEKIYAYLQDDVTKKRPSVDLILNLLCSSFQQKVDARNRFMSESPLVQKRILHLFVDCSQPEPVFLQKYCKLDHRIVNFLLGSDGIAEPVRTSLILQRPEISLEAVPLPLETKEKLSLMIRSRAKNDESLALYLQGPPGAGKQSLAAALCREINCPLLVVHGKELLQTTEQDFQAGVQLVVREALLQKAAVYWRDFDVLLKDEKDAMLDEVLHSLDNARINSFLGGEATWEPSADQLRACAFIRVKIPFPDANEQLSFWDRSLPGDRRAPDLELNIVCARFRLNPGQIRAASKTAQNLARLRDPHEGRVNLNDLFAACRLHSNRKLASLAHKIEPKHSLKDIVLPPEALAQLDELLDQVKYRHIVYNQWGFERKLSLGKGLNALFCGPPGTGKTMAAEVIANELQIDLYKIDLSQIVSKYIGETEKNLDRIFHEAQGSNAILFFDEADALFGKRSEVKDAHDRYANIEIGYLLQKMEEYEGIAILATNLRQNMDEAFVRRLHVIIEFPFPDEEYRKRIWQVAFPHLAPISEQVDFALLAREIRLAGGNINNIALSAAFLAAGNGKMIKMDHVLQAAHREHEKLGRSWAGTQWPRVEKIPSEH